MEQSLTYLKMLLEKQNELVIELLQLGEEELEALKFDKLEELQAITKKQQLFSEQLSELEKERLALQTDLAKQNALTGQLTLQDLIDSNLPGSQQVAAIGSTLKENYLKLKELNETNNLLIRQSLAYVNKILAAAVPKNQATYGQSGQINNKQNTNIKLNKSV